jgi:hypothetical protein
MEMLVEIATLEGSSFEQSSPDLRALECDLPDQWPCLRLIPISLPVHIAVDLLPECRSPFLYRGKLTKR